MPSRTRANSLARASEVRSFGIGEELSVEGVGDPALEAAQGFKWGLAGGELASVVGPAGGVERTWVAAAMGSMRFIFRLPARDSRCLICSPEEASKGAVPVQDANRLRSANRATVLPCVEAPRKPRG